MKPEVCSIIQTLISLVLLNIHLGCKFEHVFYKVELMSVYFEEVSSVNLQLFLFTQMAYANGTTNQTDNFFILHAVKKL